jgi:hypothetical protein
MTAGIPKLLGKAFGSVMSRGFLFLGSIFSSQVRVKIYFAKKNHNEELE